MLVLSGIICYAQPEFKLFNKESGLSDNSVTSIAQDKVGYLWIGTINGLNRFDGNTFKVFRNNPSDTNSIAQNSISTLTVDRKNRVWIGHNSKGITCYDPASNRFTRFRLLGDTVVCNVNFIFIDKEEVVWIGLGGYGMAILNQKTNEIKKIDISSYIHKDNNPRDALSLNSINGMSELMGDSVLLATADGLYSYKITRGLLKPLRLVDNTPNLPRTDFLLRMKDDGNGGYWFPTYMHGISHYNPKSHSFNSYKFEPLLFNCTYDLLQRDENSIWVAGYLGIGIFNIQTKVITYYKPSDIASNLIDTVLPSYCLFQDKDENVWVGSANGLIIVHQRANKWIHKPIFRSSPDFAIYDIVNDAKLSKNFFATDGGEGLLVSDGNERNWRYFNCRKNPRYEVVNRVTDLYNEGDTLWVVSRDNIRLFDKVRETWIEVPQLIALETYNSPSFLRMIESSSKDYWVASHRNGAYRIRNSDLSTTNFAYDPKSTNSIMSNRLMDVIEDKFGRIWFASIDRGVSIYDPQTDNFKFLSDSRSAQVKLPTSVINSLATDENDNIWMASQDLGVFKATLVSKDSIRIETFEDDRFTLPTYQIMIDEKNNVWFHNSTGVNVLNQESGQITQFGTESGLRSNLEFKALLKLQDRVVIGGMNGYYEATEEYSDRDTLESPLVFNSFRVFGKELFPIYPQEKNQRVDLQYNQNTFTIDYSVIDFVNPQMIQYSYQLEGVEDRWSVPSNNRSITFANLKGGQYLFKLRATNRLGKWSKEPLLLYITVQTPFWQTNWFLITMSVGLAVLTFGIMYWRVSVIKKREIQNTAMNKKIAEMELSALRAQINPHFLFNSLTSINRFIVKSDPIKASEYLINFSRLIRLILESSREQFIPLTKELIILDIYLELESYRSSKPFTYSITVSDDIDKVGTCVPSMITQPYVENAIWHGLQPKETPGNINIAVSIQERHLIFAIEDNGVGREANRNINRMWKKKSFGMKITEERLKTLNLLMKHDSSVDIIDLVDNEGEGAGTRVILKLEFIKL